MSRKARTCWAASLGECEGGLSGEHLFSRGLFSGKTVQVQGTLWNATTPKFIGLKSLTANILCRKHNSALSILDNEAISAFKAIRRFEEILSQRELLTTSAALQHDVEGHLLERWFIKTAVNLFVISGSTNCWCGGSAPQSPPRGIVEAAFGAKKLKRPQGLYNWAGLRRSERRVVGDQVGFQPIFDSLSRFLGGVFEFQALTFLIWLSEIPPGLEISGMQVAEYYHHMGGIFEAPPLRAQFRVHWD